MRVARAYEVHILFLDVYIRNHALGHAIDIELRPDIDVQQRLGAQILIDGIRDCRTIDFQQKDANQIERTYLVQGSRLLPAYVGPGIALGTSP